ncbi:hypothetical protein KWH04_15735 [Xanthomonas campestris pv. trichodesmae]|uniref:hypothetical protein n=1 Tax=Xanthomonas citri TaxID=346 RepID=UPI0012FDB0BA|nr:hypothetical protein [Xanthomonas citri]MBV6782061.1 hypothetical protein [Xanthomonas campestris pv. trichodesmae]
MIKISMEAQIRNCGTAISVPDGTNLEFAGLIDNCGTGLQVRDSSVLTQIGLREDTPPHELAEVLEIIKSNSELADRQGPKLAKYLAIGSDLSTVIKTLAEIVQSPAGQSFIKMFAQ